MNYRIAMVALDNLFKVAKENSKNLGEDLNYSTELYEAGMKDVLREVAYKKLLEIEHTFQYKSQEYKNAGEDAVNSYDLLKEQLQNQNQQSLLLDVEAAYNYLAALESEQHFIRGYVEGYKFVKELNS